MMHYFICYFFMGADMGIYTLEVTRLIGEIDVVEAEVVPLHYSTRIQIDLNTKLVKFYCVGFHVF